MVADGDRGKTSSVGDELVFYGDVYLNTLKELFILQHL